MIFKDIKPGLPIYILQKAEGRLNGYTGTVESASAPHFEVNTGLATNQMVIDFVISFNGTRKQYCIPESASVTSADGNNLIMCADKDFFLREVQAKKAQATDIIKSVTEQENIVNDCDKIITEYDTSYKEKKEVEERFINLESSLIELKDIVKSLAQELKG